MKGFLEAVNCLGDRAYTRNMGAGPIILFDTWGELYCRENNLTDDQLDEALNAMAVSCRRAAARHPLALKRTEFSTEAKEAGFDDVMEYMRSSFNPKLSQHLRASGFETKCDGASALIVCPTEMAHQFRQKPVEVLGIGSSALESGTNTHLEKKITAESARQVYELTGVKPEEIDILYTADFFITSGLLSAEEVGYLPKGEGWKHVLEGRTAFDGDKPMNTNGGRCHFGHAHGTSGLADHWEAVKQLRGVCGDRQVKGDHRTAMLRGYGGGQNATAHILRIAD
jgi:acetyl-CoA C-acetyltransferase